MRCPAVAGLGVPSRRDKVGTATGTRRLWAPGRRSRHGYANGPVRINHANAICTAPATPSAIQEKDQCGNCSKC
jgi:hypothetical protein